MLEIATWLVFFAFYIVSLPLAYYFTFPLDWGMVGLWWGVVCGSISEVLLYVLLLKYICNWERLALKISQSMKESSPNISFKKAEELHEPIYPPTHSKKQSIEY
jgi:MATE family multidrug resistance protein